MRLRAAEIAAWTGGTLRGDDVEVVGVATDSRELAPGQLFVPIVAARDGHDFIEGARRAGAALHLTARPATAEPAVEVEDTAAALARLASAARERLPERVVGVTGSVGKTTVKDLLAAALRTTYETAASHRSHNNEIGVPLTILNAPDGAEALVVEMGARGVGHIDELCDVARPTIGVVTTVAMAHTELFGGLDAVARAKGELVERLPSSGIAVLNADVPEVAAMATRSEAAVVRVSAEGSTAADVVAEGVVLDERLAARFTLRSPWGSVAVRLAVSGAHQVGNALAAAAAALAADVPLDAVAEGLAGAELSPWRMDLQHRADGLLVLNDAYNANPASMEAALRAVAALPATGRRVAVLGPMAELGAQGVEAHRRIAALAAELGVEVLALAAPDYGPGVTHVADHDEAFDAVRALGSGDALLMKGSRVAGLERLAGEVLGAG